MITLLHVTGPMYLDPDGNAVRVEAVFYRPEAAHKHYEAVGIGTDYIEPFIR